LLKLLGHVKLCKVGSRPLRRPLPPTLAGALTSPLLARNGHGDPTGLRLPNRGINLLVQHRPLNGTTCRLPRQLGSLRCGGRPAPRDTCL
jgi:hypothetical protein